MPTRFHCSTLGAISTSTNLATWARNISCSSVKISRRILLLLIVGNPYTEGVHCQSRRISTTGPSERSRANSIFEGDMQYRTLGRTGENVSIVGLGGYHMAVPKDENESIRIVRTAIDNGINFMDNCWDYHDGESERRMGKALRDGYRAKVFLMTKLDSHTRAGAAKQIDE